jgi:glucose/arabinose dehydrogenase
VGHAGGRQGAHTLRARARDPAGNTTLSAPVTVNVANTNHFQNEILATGFDLPTNIEFLPDGRMLVVELQGTIKVLPPPYTTPDPTPFLQLTNVGSSGVQQGLFDMVLDPDFASNHFYYVFYTAGSPNRDRLSRFTANASNTGTVAGSEVVLYQDPQDASSEHHGGAVNFGNDGKLYFTTGEHFDAAVAQSLSSPRGKIHRINRPHRSPGVPSVSHDVAPVALRIAFATHLQGCGARCCRCSEARPPWTCHMHDNLAWRRRVVDDATTCTIR